MEKISWYPTFCMYLHCAFYFFCFVSLSFQSVIYYMILYDKRYKILAVIDAVLNFDLIRFKLKNLNHNYEAFEKFLIAYLLSLFFVISWIFFLELTPNKLFFFVFVYFASLIFFSITIILYFFNYQFFSLYNIYWVFRLFFLIVGYFFFFFFFFDTTEVSATFTFMFVIKNVFFNDMCFTFFFDKTSMFFSYLVLLILFGVFSFSYYYMLKEKKHFKFFVLLSVFSVVIFFFFHSNNILIYLLFWKLVGVVSFFLIGHYNTKISAFKSAFKAMFFNVISDFLFLFFVVLYKKTYHTFEILNLSQLLSKDCTLDFFFFKINKLYLFVILIFLFASIKSAQLISYVWLIDSMDAPAPASALIHSATLVMAGVHVIYRLREFFILNKNLTCALIIVVIFFCLLTSVSACFQKDIKKILAYSTASNTGLITVSLLVNFSDNFIYLAISHGLIKSLCFLVGAYFFSLNKHNQDMLFFFKEKNSALIYFFCYCFMFLTALPITYLFIFKHNILKINYFSNFYCDIFLVVSLPIFSALSVIYSYRVVKQFLSIFASGLKLKNKKWISHQTSINVTTLEQTKDEENENGVKFFINVFFYLSKTFTLSFGHIYFFFILITIIFCHFLRLELDEIYNIVDTIDAFNYENHNLMLILTTSSYLSFVFILIFFFNEKKSSSILFSL